MEVCVSDSGLGATFALTLVRIVQAGTTDGGQPVGCSSFPTYVPIS